MVTVEELKIKLKEYIINREKYPEVPRTLDGEVILEKVYLNGIFFGVISITFENLAATINMRDDPSLRPDYVIEGTEFAGRHVRDLTASEFEKLTGHRKYFENWRKKGIRI